MTALLAPLKILMYCRVHSGFDSGHPALRPLRGQLKLFKIAPGDFVGCSRLVLAALMTFCINLLRPDCVINLAGNIPYIQKKPRHSTGKEGW